MNNTQSYKRVTTSIKVYYIVYKTTNRVNGKFYYGKHITLDPNDSYLGSGVALQQAIQQVGKQNFTRENIKFCSSEQEMNEIEKLYISSVKSDRKLRKRCYNILNGSSGRKPFRNPNSIKFSVQDIINGRVNINIEYDNNLTQDEYNTTIIPIT